MAEFNFSEKELSYINDDIFNAKNEIYVKCISNNLHQILCTLPHGKYSIGFPNQQALKFFCCKMMLDKKVVNTNGLTAFFEMNGDCNLDVRILCNPEIVEGMVKDLRCQAVINSRKLHTNYGGNYNSESFYDTIMDCMSNDTTLLVDPDMPNNDKDRLFLRLMKIVQEENRLTVQEKAWHENLYKLHERRCKLQQERYDLLKY
ncbi:MAG: hypothetical protein IJ358_03140 [Clostridia bacterium]|nr:hypothetical protein [Clostridia bacterium]